MNKKTDDFPFDDAPAEQPDKAATAAVPTVPFWTEAPCSLNTYGVTSKGWNIQITLRADTPDALMERFGAWTRKADHYGITPKAVGPQPVAVLSQAPAAPAAQPAQNGTAPAKAPAPAAPAVPAVALRQQLVIERLEIAPRPDGKVDCKFFAAGRKFADVTGVWAPEVAARMLAETGAWTPEHFKDPGTYAFPGVVEWEPSEKLNAKGNPYKNIIAVHKSVAPA